MSRPISLMRAVRPTPSSPIPSSFLTSSRASSSTASARPDRQKLPHLLASLPKDGLAALVKPARGRPSTIYRVTRTKLKFLSGAGAPAGEQLEGSEGPGELRVSGKVWGLEYKNGHLVSPPSPLAKTEQEIRGGLKHAWVTVNPSELSDEVRASIDSDWRGVVRRGEESRTAEIKERRRRKAERIAAA